MNTENSELERSQEIDDKIDEIVNNVYPLPENELRSDIEGRVQNRKELVNALDELLRIANGTEGSDGDITVWED